MDAVELWLSGHQLIAGMIIWPTLTLIINLILSYSKAHEAQWIGWRLLDATLSSMGTDGPGLVESIKKALHQLPPSGAKVIPMTDVKRGLEDSDNKKG